MLAGILIHFTARDYQFCTIVQHKVKLPKLENVHLGKKNINTRAQNIQHLQNEL